MAIKSYPKERDLPQNNQPQNNKPNFMTAATYREQYLNKTQSKNKYSAKKQEFNNKKYDSTLEARYAEDLEFRKQQGLIVDIKDHYPVPLYVNGVKICTYELDFRTVDKYGQVAYHEVKGYEHPTWKLKKKLFMALLQSIDPGAEYIVIKA